MPVESVYVVWSLISFPCSDINVLAISLQGLYFIGLCPLPSAAVPAPLLRREKSPGKKAPVPNQYVDRTSGEPAPRQVCHSGISAVAVEAIVNYAA